MALPELSRDERVPPGTVRLRGSIDREQSPIILHPRPTTDPNDPLNWSNGYKIWNFSLACFYTLLVFVNIDIGTVAWGATIVELGFTIRQCTWSLGLNFLALAFGCILFIPFALKYGRRPVYIVSAIVDLATAVWQANMMVVGDLYGANILSGLAGATAETIVEMTIVDLFFVHQRGAANAVFLIMVKLGAFLSPVAAGYSAESQGWRWIFWWDAIFFGVCLLVFFFGYEETKYVPPEHNTVTFALQDAAQKGASTQAKMAMNGDHSNANHIRQLALSSVPRKTYRQRLTLKTTSPGSWPSFLRHLYQPFTILFTFPAFTWTGIVYGSLLAWFSVIISSYSLYFTLAPYHFSANQVGLFNLAPLIGSLIGSLYGGVLSDRLILWLCRRNNGIYEPEMRLWLALPSVLILPGGILLFGLSMARGLPWVIPAVGAGLYGFALTSMSSVALTYTMDCYREIVGDGFVGITFLRNAMATIMSFCLSKWVNAVGLDAVFATCAAIAFVVSGTTVPMMIWGKRFRLWTVERLAIMERKQFGTRCELPSEAESPGERAVSTHAFGSNKG